jgi:hypothetical protein
MLTYFSMFYFLPLGFNQQQLDETSFIGIVKKPCPIEREISKGW